MIQVLFIFIGLVALFKGELKVTAKRLVRAKRARLLGAGFIVLGGVGFSPGMTAYGPFVMILGYAAAGITLATIAFALSEPR